MDDEVVIIIGCCAHDLLLNDAESLVVRIVAELSNTLEAPLGHDLQDHKAKKMQIRKSTKLKKKIDRPVTLGMLPQDSSFSKHNFF